MSKWNPFEKHILNADPDEFAGEEDAGYGVPRDADSASLSTPESTGQGSAMPEGTGQDSAMSEGTGQGSAMPEGTGQDSAMPEGTGQDTAMPGSPVTKEAEAPIDNGPGESAAGPDSSEESAGADGPDSSAESVGAAGPDSTAGSTGAGGTPGPDNPQGQGAPGFGSGHDFEDDEPKFDTQTGERLDKPKKKLPAMLLTVVVTALAVGAFIYSVKPGALPSRRTEQLKDTEKAQTKLAVAASESEKETAAEDSGRTGKDILPVSAQTVPEQSESAAGKERTAEDAAESRTAAGTKTREETGTAAGTGKRPETGTGTRTKTRGKTGTETETETETQSEAAAGTKAGEVPQFSSDGITVSAPLDVCDLVEDAMPEIVSVTAAGIDTVRDFFNGKKEILQTDAGSGVIVDRDDQYLYIVTDAVIVDDAQDVTVGFSVKKDLTKGLTDEDTVYSARLMGVDEESLLAVIRVPVSGIDEAVLSSVKTAVLGDSDALRVGGRVFAIGNAMGRGLSVTQGIISALSRSIRYGSSDHELIQTDASLNYGNYGGALLDEAGEVIGINSGKITEDFSEGMGFAYPVNDVKKAIRRITGETAAAAGPQARADGEAAKKEEDAGSGDETSKDELTLALAQDESGGTKDTKKDPTASGDGKNEDSTGTEQNLEALSESGQTTQETEEGSDQGQLGVQVGEFSKEDQIIYRIPAGAIVASVADGSGAQACGLSSGDLITGINDRRVESVEDLKDALKGLKAGDRVKVTYIRPDSDGGYHGVSETDVTVTLQ